MATRRDVLRMSAQALVGASLAASPLGRVAAANAENQKILVVLELSGGNDGLNTLVPYGDDAYYRHRPRLGIPAEKLLKIDDHFGFREQMAGFERIYKSGQMAIVHGCGYAQPSYSHFTSMSYWHSGAPNSGEAYGWVGRLADQMVPQPNDHMIVNIDATQSQAVRSRRHTPVVFDAPDRFAREGEARQRDVFSLEVKPDSARNSNHRFLREVALSAQRASAQVREAWSRYRSGVDYGLVNLDLPKIAALIEADFPARLYYTSFRNNAFDTHVYQNNLHARLLTYASDAVAAFMSDLERIGRANDVVLLVFSEFGRRVPENDNLGTDHGTANLMFAMGPSVRGGHYGEVPSLTELDAGDNLIYTTDFRRVYASVIEGWLGFARSEQVLGDRFETFPMFS
ncbi:MAG: DUF1501 domain-containing protein [Pseudomonadota bacterium]